LQKWKEGQHQQLETVGTKISEAKLQSSQEVQSLQAAVAALQQAHATSQTSFQERAEHLARLDASLQQLQQQSHQPASVTNVGEGAEMSDAVQQLQKQFEELKQQQLSQWQLFESVQQQAKQQGALQPESQQQVPEQLIKAHAATSPSSQV
jgi:DNA replicative helicase MCM subunit Mcm2 (Cdc46/Mcm family)